MMLSELKFCVGAVAKRDLVPAMTHFRIEGGFVRSFNGTMALCSPIACDIDCVPKAAPLIKAIQLCEDAIVLSMTPAGKLRVASGPFKALIDCVSEDTPHPTPTGERIDFDGKEVLNAFKTLNRFTSDDASRPWTNGILLRGQSAFATNNVCLVEYWLGSDFPVTINVPRQAINEILRIDEPPSHAQADDFSITFHFSGGRWLRSQLYETQWPDLSRILDVDHNVKPINPKLFEALEYLSPFADEQGRVFIGSDVVSTHTDLDVGASFEISDLNMEGIYKIAMLRLLDGVATQGDFTRYPKPTIFYGERLRGAIVGLSV